MIIDKLLKELNVRWQSGPLNVDVKGIAYDSRLVGKDFLFVAVRGFSADGHDFIKDAVNKGAAVIVAEHPSDAEALRQSGIRKEITVVCVYDSREALALLSSAFYGHPSKSLSLVGITGTNGKTTTSFITKSIINANGEKAGLLGTICYITGDKITDAPNTTPESLDLQRYLSEMVSNKMRYGVLEVSSHALALKRVMGCSFAVAAFTNFSQDHLDFHGTMEEYFAAKSKLFNMLNEDGTAVLNQDDPRVSALRDSIDRNVITYGIGPGAMIRAENIRAGSQKSGAFGMTFDVRTPEGGFEINSGLIGRFNIYNILASVGIARALGIKDAVIQQGVRDARPVEGRFESVNEGQGFLCIIDYAHTEDAMMKLIEEARHITKGRIITVFGCGGDRDKTKRPLMGAAASELSDIVIVTSDNPRTEGPSAIIEDIVRGIKKNNYTVQPDREEAIKEAVSIAKDGDTVLIAGKGHETYQEINRTRHHFSDKEVAKKAIKGLNKK